MVTYMTILYWFIFEQEKYERFVYLVDNVGVKPKYAVEKILKNL